MESIRQAVERAKAVHIPPPGIPEREASDRPQMPRQTSAVRVDVIDSRHGEVVLKDSYLQSKRIISHDSGDPRSKAFDMLRTQVLRTMDLKGWQILAVTSPTPKCGKTVTAINLALSIARQPERSVLLVDMDLQKPHVARCLGLRGEEGLLGVLEGHMALGSAIVQARVGKHRFMVLPIEHSTSGSAEWMASRAMGTTLQNIKRDYPSRIVILDLPPMLTSDDVIAILPQVDCVLLVAAVGTSTTAEIEECNRHLQSADVVRLVLNKVPQASTKYYYD